MLLGARRKNPSPVRKLLSVAADRPAVAEWQFPSIVEEVVWALLRGDDVLVHCVAGVNSTAVIGTAIRAIVCKKCCQETVE